MLYAIGGSRPTLHFQGTNASTSAFDEDACSGSISKPVSSARRHRQGDRLHRRPDHRETDSGSSAKPQRIATTRASSSPPTAGTPRTGLALNLDTDP